MRNMMRAMMAVAGMLCSCAVTDVELEDQELDAELEQELGVDEQGLAVAAGPRPIFYSPFVCGDKWRFDTWGHAPALDMVREPNQVGTEGAPLLAPAAGVVNQSFRHANAGNMVQINHGGGWFTTYLHLQSRSVSVGQSVARGQQIGRVGKDGATSNGHPHLHFELAIDANGDGRASWGGANTERVRPWLNQLEYGQANNLTWRNVTSENCSYPVPAPTSCGTFASGQGLSPNQSLWSCDGRFRLWLQSDGHLVLYRHGVGPLWGSQTFGAPGRAVMQTDGNFVVYNAANSALWATGTWGFQGAFARVQDDGNFVVYEPNGSPIWATGTSGN